MLGAHHSHLRILPAEEVELPRGILRILPAEKVELPRGIHRVVGQNQDSRRMGARSLDSRFLGAHCQDIPLLGVVVLRDIPLLEVGLRDIHLLRLLDIHLNLGVGNLAADQDMNFLGTQTFFPLKFNYPN